MSCMGESIFSSYFDIQTIKWIGSFSIASVGSFFIASKNSSEVWLEVGTVVASDMDDKFTLGFVEVEHAFPLDVNDNYLYFDIINWNYESY